VGIGPSGRSRLDNERQGTESLAISIPAGGHGALVFLQEERQRHLGKDARLLRHVGTVFPNMSFLARQPRSIAVWHPRGALKTEAWR
jgi:hypothetical protein